MFSPGRGAAGAEFQKRAEVIASGSRWPEQMRAIRSARAAPSERLGNELTCRACVLVRASRSSIPRRRQGHLVTGRARSCSSAEGAMSPRGFRLQKHRHRPFSSWVLLVAVLLTGVGRRASFPRRDIPRWTAFRRRRAAERAHSGLGPPLFRGRLSVVKPCVSESGPSSVWSGRSGPLLGWRSVTSRAAAEPVKLSIWCIAGRRRVAGRETVPKNHISCVRYTKAWS